MSQKDHLHRFTLEQLPIRGEIVQLNHSYKSVLETHSYPKPVQQLLGEFLSAAALLSSTIKFDGTLSLRVHGGGPITMLVAECRNQSSLRAVASYTDEISQESWSFGDAHLAITIEPNKGQSYQGIVELKDTNLSDALEDYFQQSEQLLTRIWLTADAESQRTAGLLLQAMPESASDSQLSRSSENWSRIEMLSETITNEELLDLDPETILFRLYHEEQVRLYPATELAFECSCSHERAANSLLTIGKAETDAALEASGDEIAIDCHFCRSTYIFTRQDIEDLFANQIN